MDIRQDVDSFLDLLQKSDLLPPQRFSAVVEQFGLREKQSAEEVARALVASRQITRYHAVRLLDGRYRGFFIDRYKLLELLGAGGMGHVYVVEDQNDGRRYALKVLAEEQKHDAGMLARLKLEARAGLMLHHPNLIRTYRLGDNGLLGILYLVMEFVEGISLPELVIKLGRCPWPQACDFIRQAAEGLDHAHQAGLVHRDVKPANLLVDRSGHVKILDFGLARLPDEEENEFSLTMIFGHDCVGTPDYMAPEQTVDSFAIDARADIYSLGLTFYSALTGQFPFAAGSRSTVLEAQRTAEPRPMVELLPDLPRPLCEIFDRMTAKSPEARFQTAREVADALAPYSQGGPIEFDFRAILAGRSREARRRSAALRERQSRIRTASTIAGAMVETSANNLPFSPSRAPRHPEAGREFPPSEDLVSAAEALHSSNQSASPPAGDYLIPSGGGERIPLNRGELILGRSSQCDVTVTAQGVSSRHCRLLFEGGWWKVIDLDSKNGTRVNGAPVAEQILWSGDRITLAGQSFQFERRSEARGGSRGWRIAIAILVAAATAAAAGTAWWLAG